MLTHKIIIEKPAEPSKVILLPHLSPAAANSAWNFSVRNIKSQLQLNQYLAGTGFDVDDFMTLNREPVTTLHHVHRIIQIQNEFNKLQFTAGTQKACPFRFLSLKPPNSDSCTIWDRWDSHEGYRSLNQTEFEKVVLPHLDYLQDYCKKHLAENSK